jgi:AraC family transcriptional regulator of adaptative response/methylated-DNA-[protein]-cysteine methyltransferase
VRFFETAEAAERAGFRACQRCGPNDSSRDHSRASAIARACSLIERSRSIPSRHELAAAAGLGSSEFPKIFQSIVGVTPKEYAMSVRAERLRQGLSAGESVTGAVLGAGFGSITRGYEASSAALGMTPRQYRKKGEGVSIRYATAETSLGFLLVAATERGVCSIALGDSSEGLILGLIDRFPNADVAEDQDEFASHLRTVVALIETPRLAVDLPLDIQGTAFQRLVWQALREIPVGSTATYAEVACAIGRPSSVRAVANACGSNELAVVIPCHRVVRTDGGLGGYRWGIVRKRALLDKENS